MSTLAEVQEIHELIGLAIQALDDDEPAGARVYLDHARAKVAIQVSDLWDDES